jgi:hypothetical protein
MVRRAPREGGFAIGLSGGWGSGKTSILNMVFEALETEDGVVPVRFSPWLFSTGEDLATRFFAELGAQIAGPGHDRGERLREAAGELGRLGRLLAPSRDGGALDGPAPSVVQRRDEVGRLLAAQDSLVAILIDDIDRLSDAEIRELARLVRAVGELPNIVYLLAFDRVRVERALAGDDDAAAGRAYLEKVCQVVHDVPHVNEQLFRHLLREEVGRATSDRLTDAQWDEVGALIRPFIGTVRDLRRFQNALGLTFALVGDRIDLRDVLVLETMRVFLPQAFVAIPRAMGQSAPGPAAHGAAPGTPEDRERGAAEAAGPLLRFLFPAHSGRAPFAQGQEAPERGDQLRERRVAARENLALYLQTEWSPFDLSSARLVDIAEAGDRDGLERFARRLQEADLLEAVLSGAADALSPTTAEIVALALMTPDDLAPAGSLPQVLRATGDRLPETVARLVALAPGLSAALSLVNSFEPHDAASDNPLMPTGRREEMRGRIASRVVETPVSSLAQERSLGTLVFLVLRHREADAPALLGAIAEHPPALAALLRDSHRGGSILGWEALRDAAGDRLREEVEAAALDAALTRDEPGREAAAAARRLAG